MKHFHGLWLLALLSLVSPLAAEPLIFSNFSQPVVLTPQQDQYVVQGLGLRVQVAHRLIVRTAAHVNGDALRHAVRGITRVTSVFEAARYHFYLLELNAETSLQAALEQVQQQPGVEQVQPDILQLASRADASADRTFAPHPVTAQELVQLRAHNSGRGVKIAIIDDGIDLQHPRLRHVNLSFAYDTTLRQLQAEPMTRRDTHGTRVAGILFASASPGTFAGLAPEAELIAIRQPDSWTSNTLLAFQLAALAGADIINCSWHTAWLLEPVSDAVKELATHGRDGKGTVVVFAAGNQGRQIGANASEAAIDAAIVVAAADAQGRLLATSNFGPSVDMHMYGGTVSTTAVDDAYEAIGGTSLAAALASGLAALMIAENPQLELPALLKKMKQVSAATDPEALHAGL